MSSKIDWAGAGEDFLRYGWEASKAIVGLRSAHDSGGKDIAYGCGLLAKICLAVYAAGSDSKLLSVLAVGAMADSALQIYQAVRGADTTTSGTIGIFAEKGPGKFLRDTKSALDRFVD